MILFFKIAMKKLISYPFTIFYYISFGLFLIIFHPIQWICFKFFGNSAHAKSVTCLNLFLTKSASLLGVSYNFENLELLPSTGPIIIIANHQSHFEIPALIWYLRKIRPIFISKKELGKGIPSISYNLRHGGSGLIDRKDPKQAIAEIKKVAQDVEKNNRAVIIFPEGTRSKTGVPKKFQANGIKTLCKYAPSAKIVPISINNSWKMVAAGKFPLLVGNTLIFTIHKPFSIKEMNLDEVVENAENIVLSGIKLP